MRFIISPTVSDKTQTGLILIVSTVVLVLCRLQGRSLRVRIGDQLTCMLGNKPKCVIVAQNGINGNAVSFKKGNVPGQLELHY